MQGRPPDPGQQSFLNQDLRSQLDHRHPLFRLAERMPWDRFEQAFGTSYAAVGRPGIAVRMLVSLLILKQLHDLSDEEVVARWMENPFWQFFSGREHFAWKPPCDPCELTRFRQRIGTAGAELILQVSVELNQPKVEMRSVVVDTTVQEKAIAYPTDCRLYQRVAERCVGIAHREGIRLRRTYRRLRKRLWFDLRTRNFPKAKAKARRAERKLRIIAARLVRDLRRKLSDEQLTRHFALLERCERIVHRRREDDKRLYSLHEPDICCIGKGKDHKRYEFGSKVSLAIDARSGVIVSALNWTTNPYDGHTVTDTLEQIQRLTGRVPQRLIGDLGYRGAAYEPGVQLITTDSLKRATRGGAWRRQLKRWLRRRSAIEPVIGHLKSDYRLGRNHLAGWMGDEINVLMAAAAWNFRKLMRGFLWLRLFWAVLVVSGRQLLGRRRAALLRMAA